MLYVSCQRQAMQMSAVSTEPRNDASTAGAGIGILAPCSLESEEAVEDLSAVMIEHRTVAYQEIDILAVGDQQSGWSQAANVFFTLENERCAATVGFNPPGAGGSKT